MNGVSMSWEFKKPSKVKELCKVFEPKGAKKQIPKMPRVQKKDGSPSQKVCFVLVMGSVRGKVWTRKYVLLSRGQQESKWL